MSQMAGVTYKSPIPQFRAQVTMLLIMKYGTWPMECDLYFRPINVLKCNCKWITDELQLWQIQTWLVGTVVTCRCSENHPCPYPRLAVMFWWSPGTVVRVFHGIRVGECCLEILRLWKLFVLHVVKLEVYFIIAFVHEKIQEEIHANFWKLSVKF